jgi:hypothetical protein
VWVFGLVWFGLVWFGLAGHATGTGTAVVGSKQASSLESVQYYVTKSTNAFLNTSCGCLVWFGLVWLQASTTRDRKIDFPLETELTTSSPIL